MQLHAEAVLDLSERPCKEIQFRAVAGDFNLLQGKFLLSEPQLEVSAFPPLHAFQFTAQCFASDSFSIHLKARVRCFTVECQWQATRLPCPVLSTHARRRASRPSK